MSKICVNPRGFSQELVFKVTRAKPKEFFFKIKLKIKLTIVNGTWLAF
jgi:hypothetical protein